MVTSRRTKQKKVKRALIAFLTLAVLAVGGLALYGAWVEDGVFSWKRPRNLGFSNGRMAPCRPTPNCVSSQAARTDSVHYIEPIPFKGTTLDALAAVRRALAQTGRTRIIAEGPNYLYAEFRTPIMRYVDDVEFGFDPGRSVIHVRSASRLGWSDLGVNRERIEKLRSVIAAFPASTGKAAPAGTK